MEYGRELTGAASKSSVRCNLFSPVSKDQQTHEDKICWPFVRVPISGAGAFDVCISSTLRIALPMYCRSWYFWYQDIVSCGNKVVGTPTIWMTSDGMILPMEFEFAVVPATYIVFVFIRHFLAVSSYLTLIDCLYQKRYVHPYSVIRLALLRVRQYIIALFTEATDHERIIQAGKDARSLWFASRAWRGVNPEGYFGDLGSWAEKRMEELGVDSAGVDSAMSPLVITDSNNEFGEGWGDIKGRTVSKVQSSSLLQCYPPDQCVGLGE
ncbi:hypothetical protein LZ554_009520 [Drepanopeziza brunnea f. sp. 'monogermtubi']|nr:hypothetical protein LZ554_009520 [Drepanopeziza brunnea f. sp. 'monogermtubi']